MLLLLPGPQKTSLEAATDFEQVSFPLLSVISKTHTNSLTPAAVSHAPTPLTRGFDVKDVVALLKLIASRH